MALDQWSWFWIVQEAVIVAVVTGLILLCVGKFMSILIPSAIILLGLLLLIYIWKDCRKYAAEEIEQILQDQLRKKEVEEVFNAL